jgi:pyridoxamine 5'-phosphate oxidase
MQSPLARLEKAIEQNLNTDFRHVQLATLDTDGHPACRTIVFRQLDTAREEVLFITDSRSHKAAEIHRQPRVEACWYLPGTREQFRLRGNARLIGEQSDAADTQTRAEIWQRLSPETRRLFAAPAPGTPVTNAPDLPTVPEAPPTCFVLLALHVDGVDHLRLSGEPHERHLYRKDGEWTAQRLHP